MADEVKETPKVLIGGNISSQPEFGAYSASSGSSFARDISRKTPYALLEKTGQLSEKQAMDAAQKAIDSAAQSSGASLEAQKAIGKAQESAKLSSVMEANNRWLRELGITTASMEDFQKAWATDANRRRRSEHEWRDTYGGKLAIRTFSRGVLGSVFFAAGQHMTGKYLRNYAFNVLDETKNSKVTNPLEFVARLFDKTLGKGIYKAALVVHKGDTAKAANVVTFRHTNNNWEKYVNSDGSRWKGGRSYGHEGLAITFDFGLASLGDYFGREIAGLVDPNTEKKWMKNGHIDIPQATKALLKSMWVGTSKAMGEDYFAMAAGYPYVVRGTRNMINKFSKGFDEDSDHWANGGSVKVDKNGQIVGNYQLEGMADLGLRFTAYNVYTKMYRDGYDKLAGKLKHFWDGDRTIHMPHLEKTPTPINLFKDAVDGVAKATRYVVRTIVKVGIIMIPSSTVFAVIRSAQSKDIGLAIHPELGPVGVRDDKGNWRAVSSNGTAGGKRSDLPLTANTQYYFKYQTDDKPIALGPKGFEFAPDRSKGYERRYDPFSKVTPETAWHDKFTNPIGRFCYNAGNTLTEVIKPVARVFGAKDTGEISRHAQRYMDATLAYTPYFMAKTDLLATAYDTPRMDMAIDRTYSGLLHFRFGEFKAGAGEILHTIENRAFSDPDREKLAQKKMRTYTNQLWSNQEEILAKEREEEYQERMDAMMTMGKPVSMQELYRKPFTERVGGPRKGQADMPSANDSFYAQNITPITPKKPEDYLKTQEPAKKQANGWEKAVRDFKTNTSTQGQTIN